MGEAPDPAGLPHGGRWPRERRQVDHVRGLGCRGHQPRGGRRLAALRRRPVHAYRAQAARRQRRHRSGQSSSTSRSSWKTANSARPPCNCPGTSDRLEEGLVELGCRFLVFDALTSFKSSRMSANSGDDVRAFLEPIQRMAGRLNAVILGIAHLGKDAERKARDSVKGASEWTDVPRQVLVFHREDSEAEGVISDVKGNLFRPHRAPSATGSNRFELPEHAITEVGRVVFTGDVDTSVDEARRSSLGDDDQDDRSAALRWARGLPRRERGDRRGDDQAARCEGAVHQRSRTIERSIRAKGVARRVGVEGVPAKGVLAARRHRRRRGDQ